MLITGFTGVAAGVALLLLIPEDDVPLALLLSAFTVMGFSLGLASVSSTTAGTAEVVEGERGVAAGVLTSSAQLGATLGLALCAPVAAATDPLQGYRFGFLVGIGMAFAGAMAAFTVPRAVRRTAPDLG
jgi:MFS family permease